MKNFKSFIKSRNTIFLIFLFLGLLGLTFYYFLGPFSKLKNVNFFRENQKAILEKEVKEKEKYLSDTYGGKDPLETYQLFLKALKNQEIDLAVKYFPLDLQEKYLKLFSQIKNSGQWDKMMNDLLKEENQKGEYITDDWYNIKIKNDKNEVVTTVVLKIIKDFEGRPINNLWKIVEF